ncbi:MAG: hypothetical protein OEM00_07230 [Burkholderiaceae bacterium]|nr:hypothetical protein [Burkholderiaceae bacterium]
MIDLSNKVVLVSKRIIKDDGAEFFDTFFGTVKSYNENTVILTKQTGHEVSIPNSEELYEVAEEGFYELNDGSTYENPDLIAQFVVYQSNEAYEKFKGKNE